MIAPGRSRKAPSPERAAPAGRAYGRGDLVRAIAISAIVGWSLHAAATLAPLLRTDPNRPAQFLDALVLHAVFGLPLAGLSCIAIGGPILYRTLRHPIGWRRAAVWGGVVALAMCLTSFAILELPRRLDRSSNFSFRDGTGPIIENNVRTAYGWTILLRRWLRFVLIGIVTALIVRAAIGPGRDLRN